MIGAGGGSDREAAIAALRREFADGLSGRLATLEDALAACARGDRAAGETLARGAHTLKGTAAAYGAAEVAACARELEDRVRRWVGAAAAPPASLAAARDALDRLARALAAYRASVARGDAA